MPNSIREENKARERSRLRQSGVILLETLVGISVISTTVLVGLVALSTASVASQEVSDNTQGAVLAVSQLELIKTLPYEPIGNSYTSITVPDGYAISNMTSSFPGGNANIQSVTVTVTFNGGVIQEQSIVKINR